MKIDIDRKLLKSLLIMGSVVEARDAYTGGHLWRVAQYSKFLCGKIGLPRNNCFLARIGGFLHDIGKIGIPDTILLKPSALNDREYAIVRTHPDIGFHIIHEHPLAVLSQDVIRHHHEWYNGKGYPDGLARENISLLSRITSIADAFDAMTSTRPYRKRMPVKESIAILTSEKDRQFDGKLVSHFLEISVENKLSHIVGHSDEGIPMVSCPECGPVITVSKNTKDGDTTYCKICSTRFRLHKEDQTFTAESLNEYGTADKVKPEAEVEQIESLIEEMPSSLEI